MAEKKLVFKKDIGLVSWPCTIRVPLEGGKHQDQELTPRFRIITQGRINEFFSPHTGDGAPKGDAALLAEVIDGFDGLKDDQGSPVPDEVAKQSLLSLPYVIVGLVRGYLDMIGGGRTAKN